MYLEDDINEWCEKYNLSTSPDPCQKCGVAYPYTRVFAYRDFRGITQHEHECGPNYILSKFVTMDSEWNALVKTYFDQLESE